MSDERKLFELFAQLGANPLGLVIKVFKIEQWGNEIVFEFLTDVTAVHSEQNLILVRFKNCTKFSAETYLDNDPINNQTADVIGFHFGKEHHQEPACITTDLFEIIITYETMELEKIGDF